VWCNAGFLGIPTALGDSNPAELYFASAPAFYWSFYLINLSLFIKKKVVFHLG